MERLSRYLATIFVTFVLCAGIAYAQEVPEAPSMQGSAQDSGATIVVNPDAGESSTTSAPASEPTEADAILDDEETVARQRADQETEALAREEAERVATMREEEEAERAQEAARAAEAQAESEALAEQARTDERERADEQARADSQQTKPEEEPSRTEDEAQGMALGAQSDTIPTVRYRTHVQRDGWQAWCSNGADAGTSGRSLRMEGLNIELVDASGTKLKGISYQAHVQRIGWQDWVSDGAMAGTEGKSLRVEAIRIKLSDQLAAKYDVWYQAHIQRHGWLGWAKNGAAAGSAGHSLRVECLRICLTKKGQTPSDYSDADPFVDGACVTLEGHVQRVGWTRGTNTVGTVGQSLRMEAIRAKIAGTQYDGSILYSSHVQRIGWQAEVSNGGLSGTTGQSLRVEAITMRLEGEIANHYNLWYRLHVQSFGWLDWVSNGEKAGTAGLSRRCESIEVCLLKKGERPSSEGSNRDKGFLTAEDVPSTTSGQALSQANAAQRALVQAAHETPSAPAGYCAQWVEDVYANAGYGRFYGDACDLYDEYCHSSDLRQLKAGMIVCVSTHPHSSAGSIWGHVGVYVGDDTVLDSVYGYVRTSTLQEWMSYYGASVPVRWGWLGNINIA